MCSPGVVPRRRVMVDGVLAGVICSWEIPVALSVFKRGEVLSRGFRVSTNTGATSLKGVHCRKKETSCLEKS